MPYKRYRSKKPSTRRPSTRRRLQPVKNAVSLVPKVAAAIAKSYPRVKKAYDAYKAGRARGTSKRIYSQKPNVQLSDNIATVKPTVIGKRKPLTFNERVARVDRPPIMFKRNYEFSAEVDSGRKGWFSMEFNIMNNNDLNLDLTTYRNQQFTDTAVADTSLATQNSLDDNKFYVDYLNEKLSFMNSSSNALTGKIHLFAHRRDNENAYGTPNVPITPINLMMFYTSGRLPALVTSQESILGNGWKFDNSTSKLNYNAVYNMPGSAINASGVCAHTDLALSPSSAPIKDSLEYWFRKVDTFTFDLKPGQQFNKTYTFHDLKDIMREEQASYIHLANVSYSCVVEFQGQIVGSSLVPDVSTGVAQLSVTRQSTRQIGVRNKLRSKVVMITAPPAQIGSGNNWIINPDTGDFKISTAIDS